MYADTENGEKETLPGAKISALGCYVPPGVLTNHDLEKMVETSDQWILERTGIAERSRQAIRPVQPSPWQCECRHYSCPASLAAADF